MRMHCSTTSKAAWASFVVAILVFVGSSLAQPGEGGGAAAGASVNDAAPGDAELAEAAELSPEDAARLSEIEELYESLEAEDEAEIPEGLQPMASYAVADEITVRGLRPGDIRKRLWDLDIEIERSTLSFFRLLNDVIVDEQFHVQCVLPERTRDAQGRISTAIIVERLCYAGYQVDAMTYGDSPGWIMQKEREYTEIVMTAIREIPSLAVAAENLTSMHEERRSLTGGDQALSIEQYRRQLARDEFLAPFEALERRQQRRAEREAEREAKKQSERD